MKCPICKKAVAMDEPDFPFCGSRCRLIDLGNWSSEKYVFSTPATSMTSLANDPDADDK